MKRIGILAGLVMLTLVMVLAVFLPIHAHAVAHHALTFSPLAGLAMLATRKMDLPRAYIFQRQTFGPGKDVVVPDDFPDLDENGNVIHEKGTRAAANAELNKQRNATHYTVPPGDVGQSQAQVTGAPANAGPGRDELEKLTKADLEQMATDRGLTVTRSDGKEGDPTKQDYIDALAAG